MAVYVCVVFSGICLVYDAVMFIKNLVKARSNKILMYRSPNKKEIKKVMKEYELNQTEGMVRENETFVETS